MPVHDPTELSEDPPLISSADASGRQSPGGRRETIMNLVEMLLRDNESSNYAPQNVPTFEDEKDAPSVDEHLQNAGAQVFYKLQRRINNLDKELRNFANAARQLGSSVAILSSTFHLRDRLAQLLFLYHENAANLFPRKIAHVARDGNADSPSASRRKKAFIRRVKGKAQLHVPRPTVAENLDPESFPEQLEQLAKEVTNFLRCLNEFPEFTDEAVNASILSFEGDLNYWASCLKEYAGQFRYPAVQRYVHDLSSDMGAHFDELTSSLSMFIEVGVPTIRFAQKHGAENLLNLSTVATFFSAVTATTMQFSYQLDHTGISNSVNCFWFGSLVFSIAAAVNSLLGLTWKQAMYRSPGHRVPWWVLIWIKRSPLVFLVLSVACFSLGLCCFTYASEQARITSHLTTVLTAFTSFGLAAVSAWFASERWAFARHRGQKWLSDVLDEVTDRFLHLTGVMWLQRWFRITKRQFGRLQECLIYLCKVLKSGFTCKTCVAEDDLEANGLPTTMPQSPNYEPKDPTSPEPGRPSDVTAVISEPSTPVSPAVPPTPVNSPVNAEFSPPDSPTPTASPSSPSRGKQLWKNAVRNVKMHNAISPISPTFSKPQPVRQRTASSGFTSTDERSRKDSAVTNRARVSNTMAKLSELYCTHDLAVHSALVRHMAFSPDGKFMATSSWDKTSIIFRVGNPFTPHRTLAHPQGFVGFVAWSPNGKTLLTKMARGIKVWNAETGVCEKTINRNAAIEVVTWFPHGEAFLSIEGSVAFKLDLKGKVLDQYDFGNMKLHDLAITPDSTRLVGVGPLLRSPTGLQPSRSRVEKRLAVYNVDTKHIESLTPVLEDVRSISLALTSRNGLVALISYESKAPPQVWKLEFVRDRDTNLVSSRLSLRHTYMPRSRVEFSGPSYFGGKDNELVICSGKAGDIHVWDQESGILLHVFQAQAHPGDITCVAWNQAAILPFMFATGSHDGVVRIWTREPYDPDTDHTPKNIAFPRSSSPYQFGSSMSGSTFSLEDH
ncbi:hypothetical protein CVT26_009513 [Gymnopilus dilepis]|uniref:Anaphase-promoting complex subunit 4 WD40 domain-containing protein n=1 Tax=Gymnopilus dilepis TaxID=231916 RepID=A0A409VJX1_9AGAR|nr:hypothetical protein CVT26_009513 [Gymnopilus dilepis]